MYVGMLINNAPKLYPTHRNQKIVCSYIVYRRVYEFKVIQTLSRITPYNTMFCFTLCRYMDIWEYVFSQAYIIHPLSSQSLALYLYVCRCRPCLLLLTMYLYVGLWGI